MTGNTLLLLLLALVALSSAACSLSCRHGGKPNKDCTECTGCLSAWTGKHCTVWDESVAYDKLIGDLVLIGEVAKKEHNIKATPEQLDTSLGNGVDISTGTTKLPVLKMTYKYDHTWTNALGQKFYIPDNTTVASTKGNVTTPYLFEGMYDYVQFLHGIQKSGKVNSTGAFADSDDLVQLYIKYFSGNSYMTVVKDIFPHYVASLSKDLVHYELDPYCEKALNYLPPAFNTSTSQALYRTFVTYWGTSFMYSTTNGGLLNMQTFIQKTFLPQPSGKYDKDGIMGFSKEEFEIIAWHDGTEKKMDLNYTDHRTLGTLGCQGGDAAEYCSPDQLKEWERTTNTFPTPITYHVLNISTILTGTMKTNIQKAIQDFLTAQYDKWTKNFPTCPTCMWGDCKQGETKCTCYNPHITGVACDACISGWGNIQCNQPVCKSCPDGTYCIGPNECSQPPSFSSGAFSTSGTSDTMSSSATSDSGYYTSGSASGYSTGTSTASTGASTASTGASTDSSGKTGTGGSSSRSSEPTSSTGVSTGASSSGSSQPTSSTGVSTSGVSTSGSSQPTSSTGVSTGVSSSGGGSSGGLSSGTDGSSAGMSTFTSSSGFYTSGYYSGFSSGGSYSAITPKIRGRSSVGKAKTERHSARTSGGSTGNTGYSGFASSGTGYSARTSKRRSARKSRQ